MTSLALLEHVATTAPAFNSDFYVTAATVIPVLFVALAVQHGTIEEMMTAAARVARYAHKSAWTFVAVAYLTLLIGVIAETIAFVALNYRIDDPSLRAGMLAAIIVLSAATFFLPGTQMVRVMASMRDSEPSPPGAKPANPQTETAPGCGTSPSAQTEPGRTDGA